MKHLDDKLAICFHPKWAIYIVFESVMRRGFCTNTISMDNSSTFAKKKHFCLIHFVTMNCSLPYTLCSVHLNIKWVFTFSSWKTRNSAIRLHLWGQYIYQPKRNYKHKANFFAGFQPSIHRLLLYGFHRKFNFDLNTRQITVRFGNTSFCITNFSSSHSIHLGNRLFMWHGNLPHHFLAIAK